MISNEFSEHARWQETSRGEMEMGGLGGASKISKLWGSIRGCIPRKEKARKEGKKEREEDDPTSRS